MHSSPLSGWPSNLERQPVGGLRVTGADQVPAGAVPGVEISPGLGRMEPFNGAGGGRSFLFEAEFEEALLSWVRELSAAVERECRNGSCSGGD